MTTKEEFKKMRCSCKRLNKDSVIEKASIGKLNIFPARICCRKCAIGFGWVKLK